MFIEVFKYKYLIILFFTLILIKILHFIPKMLPSKNYFSLFNLNQSYNIDTNALKTVYYDLNRKYHPDITNNDPNLVQQLNMAYKTLKDDYLRAKYLYNSDVKDSLDQKFLLEILELEEQITDATEQNLFDLESKIDLKIQDCKEKYFDSESLAKWGYYRRLKRMIQKKKAI